MPLADEAGDRPLLGMLLLESTIKTPGRTASACCAGECLKRKGTPTWTFGLAPDWLPQRS